MYRTFITGIIFCGTLFSGCNKPNAPDWVQKAGKTATIKRFTGSFHEIVIGKKFDLLLMQDTLQPEFAEITYGENLLPEIKTEVENGVLTLKDKNHFNWVRKLDFRVKVLVNIHNIDKLHLIDASSVACADTLRLKRLYYNNESVNDGTLLLDCGYLNGSCSNSSKTTLRGRYSLMALSLDDASSLDARFSKIGDCYLFYFSPLDSYVDAIYILSAEIYGRGNVHYTTTPLLSLKKVETGTGRLIKD